ncbi:MAG: PIG-L family deacetylase [bacterium]
MSNGQKFFPNERAIIIVAHPDDETIWMGGTILKNKNLNWTIFSLCRSSDSDRAPKFKKVCDYYGAKCLITDLDDEGRLNDKESREAAEKLIEEKLRGQDFDFLFTHGLNGEYGHPVHVQVHNAVKNIIDRKTIKSENVFYFNYQKKRGKNEIMNRDDSDFTVELSPKELKEKKEIVSNMYGYEMDGIDVGYCINKETFKIN